MKCISINILIAFAVSTVIAKPISHLEVRHNYALVGGLAQHLCTCYPYNYYRTAQGLPEADESRGALNNHTCDRNCNCVNIDPKPKPPVVCVEPILPYEFEVICSEVEDGSNGNRTKSKITGGAWARVFMGNPY